jgi:hypothetical protein
MLRADVRLKRVCPVYNKFFSRRCISRRLYLKQRNRFAVGVLVPHINTAGEARGRPVARGSPPLDTVQQRLARSCRCGKRLSSFCSLRRSVQNSFLAHRLAGIQREYFDPLAFMQILEPHDASVPEPDRIPMTVHRGAGLKEGDPFLGTQVQFFLRSGRDVLQDQTRAWRDANGWHGRRIQREIEEIPDVAPESLRGRVTSFGIAQFV